MKFDWNLGSTAARQYCCRDACQIPKWYEGFNAMSTHFKIVVDLWSPLLPILFRPASDPSDPSAGLMDMLKQMYDDGDDEMKQSISKAWTESRGKTPDVM